MDVDVQLFRSLHLAAYKAVTAPPQRFTSDSPLQSFKLMTFDHISRTFQL